MIQVKVKLNHPDAKMPTKAHPTDTGFDLYSVERVWLEWDKTNVVDTGISIEIPQGYEGQIRPRSGLAAKYGVTISNAPGSIDYGYTGPIKVILTKTTDEAGYSHIVKPGDRIAQLVIKKLPEIQLVEVSELSDTDRGTDGFGSTGR